MQNPLFVESLEEALTQVVGALGGAKTVGLVLWPEKSCRDAHTYLLACLNPERKEHLTGAQIMLLLRRGREARCHAAMQYLSRECGYADPVPLEPEDERARLQREFTASVDNLRRITTALGLDTVFPAPLRVMK